jgi:hypothetical protein
MKHIARRIWNSVKVEIDYDPEVQQITDRIRDIAKGLLELIRNLTVVSAIKFFATRADSWALNLVAEVGTFLIGVTVVTLLAPYSFYHPKLFGDFSRRSFLVHFVTLMAYSVVYIVLRRAIIFTIDEIVRSQLAH